MPQQNNTSTMVSFGLLSSGQAAVLTVGASLVAKVYMTAAYRFGQAQILVLLPDPDHDQSKQKVSLNLGDHKFAVNLRENKRLPRRKRVSVEAIRGGAAVVAALPYRVTGVELLTLDRMAAGNRLPVQVTLKTLGEDIGDHLVHIDVINLAEEFPKPMRHYARDVVCRNGEGATYIPLALNERPGMYKIVARDMLSDAVAETLVQVDPPPT